MILYLQFHSTIHKKYSWLFSSSGTANNIGLALCRFPLNNMLRRSIAGHHIGPIAQSKSCHCYQFQSLKP